MYHSDDFNNQDSSAVATATSQISTSTNINEPPATSTPDRPSEPAKITSYLKQAKSDLLATGDLFVDIDLDKKQLQVFENGQVQKTVPVKAIAPKSSWWRTAPGLYKAQTKIPKHKSSYGNVFMYWNIPFQGNFFIHGWPEYVGSGNAATSDVSAGCIRLAKSDAKELYEEIPAGTPIIVREKDFSPKFSYRSDANRKLADLTSDAYLAVDLKTNEVFAAKNENQLRPLGDIAVLVTGLAMTERIGVETEMYATDQFRDDNITKNRRLRLYDLLFPLLQDWRREPEATVANYMERGDFVDAVAYKARAVGMGKTAVEYTDQGVKLMASPVDLARLSEYLNTYRQFLLDITSSNEIIGLYGTPRLGRRTNSRMFPGFASFVGGAYDEKTGSAVAVFKDKTGASTPKFFAAFGSKDPLGDILTLRESTD